MISRRVMYSIYNDFPHFPLQACAPRYVFHTMTPSRAFRIDPVGTCFTSHNFEEFYEVSPCRTSEYRSAGQGLTLTHTNGPNSAGDSVWFCNSSGRESLEKRNSNCQSPAFFRLLLLQFLVVSFIIIFFFCFFGNTRAYRITATLGKVKKRQEWTTITLATI